MKRKDITALHTKTLEELEKELLEVQKKYRKAELEVVAAREKNTRKPQQLRDDAARILTIIQKKRSEAKGTV